MAVELPHGQNLLDPGSQRAQAKLQEKAPCGIWFFQSWMSGRLTGVGTDISGYSIGQTQQSGEQAGAQEVVETDLREICLAAS